MKMFFQRQWVRVTMIWHVLTSRDAILLYTSKDRVLAMSSFSRILYVRELFNRLISFIPHWSAQWFAKMEKEYSNEAD